MIILDEFIAPNSGQRNMILVTLCCMYFVSASSDQPEICTEYTPKCPHAQFKALSNSACVIHRETGSSLVLAHKNVKESLKTTFAPWKTMKI